MPRVIRAILRLLAIAIPLMFGALTVVYSENLKQPPAAKEKTQPPTAVRVVTVEPVDLLPRVSGFGTIEPAREWRAVARVEAEVIETAAELANGEIVSAGSVLFKLDDTELQLSLAQIDAQMAALSVKDETLAATQDIVAADLDLSRAELSRQETLAQDGVATQARLEAARRAELAAQAKVVEVRNQLALNAAERKVLAAQRATVERSLTFTKIAAPYDVRIGEVSAEVGQVVTRGQTLLTAEGIEAAEVAAQFSIGRIGPLLRASEDGTTVLDLKARVRLPAPGHSVVWEATVDRVGEALDAKTQSTSIVVRIDAPQAQAEAGKRPPLRRNTFVEVILMAPKRQALVAPVDAVRGGEALVITEEGTLEKRAVRVGYTVSGVAVVTEGLTKGDKLVVSDPSIAVPGMKVKPVEDKAVLAQMMAAASGQGKSKGTK